MMAKTCPSCGYREPDQSAQYCNQCGYPFPRAANPVRQPAPAPASSAPRRPATPAGRPGRRNAGKGGTPGFGRLISEEYLRLIYFIGAILIILIAILGIVGMFGKAPASAANVSITNLTAVAEKPAGSPLFWIGFLVAGSVLWRMFCELFVLLSRISQGSGEDGSRETEEETDAYSSGYAESRGDGGRMIECPKCHRLVPASDLRVCEHCGIEGCSNCIRPMGLLKKTLTCRECFEGK